MWVTGMTARTRIIVMALVLLMSVLPGCVQTPKDREPAPSLVGADRDEHGCIGSAGYSWCSREASCVRPWELAQQKGFANSAEDFKKYCSSVSQ
jgi:starvation-inducible outer membrane lipoprotein